MPSKVLLVDDHPDIRRLMAITLGNQYELLQAQDGHTALALVQQHLPQVVLLDIMMPGAMDGLEVLDAIKADPQTRHISVAMLTARGQSSDQHDALRRGADAYFLKPFSPLKVVNWVRDQIK